MYWMIFELGKLPSDTKVRQGNQVGKCTIFFFPIDSCPALVLDCDFSFLYHSYSGLQAMETWSIFWAYTTPKHHRRRHGSSGSSLIGAAYWLDEPEPPRQIANSSGHMASHFFEAARIPLDH